MAKSIIIGLFITLHATAFGQFTLAENEESTGSNNLITEALEHVKQHPINLNKIETSILHELEIIPGDVIDKIMQHVNNYGPIIHVLELQQCHLTATEIKHLLPFVYVPQHTQTNNTNKRKHTIVFTSTHQLADNKKPAGSTQYVGDAITTTFRYRGLVAPNLNVSFTGEKDAGEAYFESNQYTVFDFNSGCIQINNIRGNNSLILGDYTCNFGQGLTLGSGMRIGKSSRTVQTNKSSFGLKPYRSVTEFGFNRGAALSMAKNRSRYHLWLHHNDEDATFKLVNGQKEYSNLSRTGFHRTNTELNNKNSVRSSQIGLNYTQQFNQLKVEYTGVFTKYSGRFRKSERLYQRFNNSGLSYGKHGIAYRYTLNNGYLFGETTLCSNQKMGNLHGFVVGLGKRVSMTGLFRNVQPGFISNGSASFVESSVVNNERGIYVGLSYEPTSHSSLAVYVDQYWFPWLKSATVTSSFGVDYLVRYEARLSKSLSWHIQMKYENRQKQIIIDMPMKSTVPTGLLKVRAHISHAVSKHVKLQTRFARNTSILAHSRLFGSLLYQDIQLDPLKWPVKLYIRISAAHIEDNAVRIYTYENDLAYRFSLPSFSKSQVRSYVLVRWKAKKHVDFWIKYMLTYKNELKNFGSEWDSVSSPHVSNIHLQLRIKL